MYALFVFVISEGDGFFLGSCFAVAGVGGEVGGGSLYLRASLPSLSLWDISPPRERLFFIWLSVALYRRYWSYMSLSLWGEVGPLGLGEGELACGIVWPCMCSAVLFAWLELGWVRWLWSSLRLRASSPLPSGIRLPPSPKGDGFFLGSCFTVARVVGMFCLFLFPYISGRTKKSHLFRGGIFDIGFQYLHTVIHLGNCSGNYLVNATATYLPLPSWRPVTLKPRPSPTKRTGT